MSLGRRFLASLFAAACSFVALYSFNVASIPSAEDFPKPYDSEKDLSVPRMEPAKEMEVDAVRSAPFCGPRWKDWLAERSGPQIAARAPENALCPAPGTYVRAVPTN